MTALKAILATAGMVFVAISLTLVVLAIIWLIGNYSIDRLLGVASFLLTAGSLLLAVAVQLRRRK